jgi:uncharacterized protein YqeY
MSLKERITNDMKAAMRAKDKARLGTIRLLTSEIKQVEVDTRSQPNDAEIVKIIGKMIKQRKDAASQFEAADRPELAAQEHREIEVYKDYLPEQLSQDELKQMVTTAITEADAKGMQDMGRVMGLLQSKIAGRADMGEVSGLVKSQLS